MRTSAPLAATAANALAATFRRLPDALPLIYAVTHFKRGTDAMAFDLKTRPNAWPWPVIIYPVTIIAGLALDRWLRLPLGLPTAARWFSVVVIGVGLAVYVWAIVTMRRADAIMRPDRAASRLVDWGPFALTRNPIYVGGTLALLGVAIALNSAWFAVAMVVAAALTDRLAIRREEAHLELNFGDAWRAYAARTPRWFRVGRLRL